jgi:DNA polymerase-2
MENQGFLLTQHSVDADKHTDIHLWLSTDDGPATIKVSGERPVLFTRLEDQQKVIHSLRPLTDAYEIKPLALKTFAQERVLGVYVNQLKDYSKAQALLRQSDIRYFEADFRLDNRFLMERFIYGSLSFSGQPIAHHGFTEYAHARVKSSPYTPQLRKLSLDIECAQDGQLYSIGFYSYDDDQPFRHVIMIGMPETGADFITWVNDEQCLLQECIATIKTFDPDIIIGWNVINFDFKLLIERAKRHSMPLRLGRDNSVANWRDSRTDNQQGFIHIAGRVVIDGINALRTATYNFTSFSLENVAQALLGRGKKTDDVDNRIAAIDYDFKYNKQKLAAYNIEDCVLVADIFEHTKVLDFLIFRSQLTGLSLDKQGGAVASFTNLYLPLLHRAGYIAPNLPKHGGLASPGGYVMTSKPGLYNNVLVLDFKSLYPSIIRTFKIDPMGLIEGLLEGDSANTIPGFLEARFSRDKHFLPEIITKLWRQRDQAKKQNDAPRSQAIKLLMNSFYGVLGSGGCRFHDPRLSSSITLRGQSIMQQSTQWIEALGYTVIYGDTDSLFVLLKNDLSVNDCQRIGRTLQERINSQWRDKIKAEFNLECYLELEFETHFSRFLMPTIRGSDVGSKKRYAGIKTFQHQGQTKTELIFKGLENVRTDWTALAKDFQRALYQCIFNDEDPTELIKQTVNNTLNGLNDDKLIYRKRLRRKLERYVKNIPPHVRAARMADSINTRDNKPLKYQNKGWISYVITTQGPEAVDYQIHPLDYEHYIEKQVIPICDAILPFIGLSFKDIMDAQMTLF